MKDPVSMIVFVSVLLIVAVRLYIRHKGKRTIGSDKTESANKTGSFSQEDDYEPYKNK